MTIRLVYSDEQRAYVQDVFRTSENDVDGERTGVILCGQRDMCESVSEQMIQKGVDPNRLLLNF